MKTRIGLLMLLGLMVTPGVAQTFTETITRELVFEKKAANNALMVFNINGEVKVEGYTGDKVLIEVKKTIYGKTEARLEKGKAEIQLGVIDRADTLIVYVQGLCSEFGRRKKKENWQSGWGWGYQWNNCGKNGDCNNKEYDYKMSYTIKVPTNIGVYASTVNGGDVEISNVNGNLLADNVNGSIRLINISGTTHASTINGNVDINYSGNPSGDSKYYSLNGDINANFHKGLAAELTFKSFNGEFYSSVDDITPLPVRVEKYATGEGLQSKVNGNRNKVRTGGPLLDFETFNGDVYLREN